MPSPTVRNSAQWAALRLLKYIGVTSLDPVDNNPDNLKPGLAEGDLDDVASCLTSALQEIFKEGPASLSEQRVATNLHEPTAVILDVVNNGGATFVSGYQSWMHRCPIAVDGDPYFNEIISANPGGVLQRAYLGATANGVQATVYGNTVELADNVRNIMEPIELVGRWTLRAATDIDTFYAFGGSQSTPVQSSGNIGRPQIWFAETQYEEGTEHLPILLRVVPLPAQTEPILFRVKLNPQRIDVDDIGDEDNDPGVLFSIPGKWVESILMPIALQRWTAHAAFKNNDAKKEIARQYSSAIQALKEFRPQIARTNLPYHGEVDPSGRYWGRRTD